MKIFAYNCREFDERGFFEQCTKDYGIDYEGMDIYPSVENAYLTKGADCVSVITSTITDEFLEAIAANGVKYIVTRTIGSDHVPVEKANSLGMRVSTVQYDPSSVANYAIMMILMSCRKVASIMKRMELQDYRFEGKMGIELSNSTVGVYGTGGIGGTVVKHLSGFGCRILACDLSPKDELRQYCEYVDADTLLRESDILTIHLPSWNSNYHIIDEEAFKKMKDGVVIVNTARGYVMDTDALIDNIESGKIFAAGIDAFETERGKLYLDHIGKVQKDRQLAVLQSFPNVVVTPHVAFYTDEAAYGMVEGVYKAIVLWEKGEVNPLEVTFD